MPRPCVRPWQQQQYLQHDGINNHPLSTLCVAVAHLPLKRHFIAQRAPGSLRPNFGSMHVQDYNHQAWIALRENAESCHHSF